MDFSWVACLINNLWTSTCVAFFVQNIRLYQPSDSLIVTLSIIFFLSFSFSVSPSLRPSPRCCLAGGRSGRIIILKLKRAVWTQDWGMNCHVELAACSSSGSSRSGRSCWPRLPLILTSALRITLLFSALLRMTKVPCRQTPVKNISIHGFRPVKDEELHFDTESRLKGSVSVWVLSAAARRPGERKKTGRKGERKRGKKGPPHPSSSPLSHSEILNIRPSA